VGSAHEAADFERIELVGPHFAETAGALCFHMKNGASINFQASNAELEKLLFTLCDAFPWQAVEHLKTRGWI
jgi:hypothetical protein